MDNKAFISRAIRYQKAASDNMFSILTTLQSGGEKMVEETLNQCTWFPESGRKGLVFWYDTCTQTRSNLKQMIDQSYEEVQKYFDIPEAPAPSVEKTGQSAVSTAKKAAAPAARKKQPAKPKAAASKAKEAEVQNIAGEKPAQATTQRAKRSTPPKKTAATRKTVTRAASTSKTTPAQKVAGKEGVGAKAAAKTSADVTGAEKKAPMYNKPAVTKSS